MLSPAPQMPVYPQLPMKLVAGTGCTVIDEDGNEYLDLYGGHAVASVGHCHPRLVQAIAAQAERLIFYSNISDHPLRQRLSERLLEWMPKGLASVFLCNSGAEANENALTLARLSTGRKTIVSIHGGFHGRSLLTLAVSGIEKYRKLASCNGEALFPHVRLIEMNQTQDLNEIVTDDCAAVIIEPVQGLAGAIDASPEFLQALRKRCDETGSVLIFDEVQCGAGRMGFYTAAEAYGVTPDILTMAKGLAGGFPVGATIANEAITQHVKSGMLGSTFGGGPLACAAALATLDILQKENVLEQARSVGDRLKTALKKLSKVKAVHGRGLLLGVELFEDSSPIRQHLLQKHRIIVGSSNRPEIFRMMPPLVLSQKDALLFVEALQRCFE